MSPRTIHFRVWDKSPVSGPGRGPPSCNTTICVVSLPFFYPQHTIKIIQNKQFFKPHNIYLNTSLRGILGDFSPDFSLLWITLQQAQCIFRTAFQNSYILSVKKLHCAESLFPWKCPSLSKPGLVNKSSTIPDYTGCDWWRKFRGVPFIMCFLGGSTIETGTDFEPGRPIFLLLFDR